MESVFMHVHEPWHLIALEDLNSAKHLFLQSFMTTLFHVQQCIMNPTGWIRQN
jgi:hypothetical protein